QRNRRTPPDAEDPLFATQQAVIAIEHERAAQRREQDAGTDDHHPRDRRPDRFDKQEPEADRRDQPARPGRRARQIELDPTGRPLADAYGSEPVEHVRSVPRRGAPVDPRIPASLRLAPLLAAGVAAVVALVPATATTTSITAA